MQRKFPEPLLQDVVDRKQGIGDLRARRLFLATPPCALIRTMATNHPDYPMWNALLRWSLAQGSDGTTDSMKQPMSAEDRTFIEQVMKELTVDVMQQLVEQLEVVSQFSRGEIGGAEACEAALENIAELTQELDIARNVCKIDGLRTIFEAMQAECATSGVRRAACCAVSAIAQNDERCQEAIAAIDGATKLAAVFQAATDNEERRVAFGALSATIRGNTSLEDAFIQSTAPTVLASALASEPRTASKAAFLLYALTYDKPDAVKLEALAPAFEAAVKATAFDGSDPSQRLRRESATKALVRAATASPAFALIYRDKLEAAAAATEEASRTHLDDGLQEQSDLWSQLPWRSSP